MTPDQIRRLGAAGFDINQLADIIEILETGPASQPPMARSPAAASDTSLPAPPSKSRADRSREGTIVSFGTPHTNAVIRDFDQFWLVFPRKYHKKAAKIAFDEAQTAGLPFDHLMAELGRYLEIADVDRRDMNPVTFINATLNAWLANKPQPEAEAEPTGEPGVACPDIPVFMRQAE